MILLLISLSLQILSVLLKEDEAELRAEHRAAPSRSPARSGGISPRCSSPSLLLSLDETELSFTVKMDGRLESIRPLLDAENI